MSKIVVYYPKTGESLQEAKERVSSDFEKRGDDSVILIFDEKPGGFNPLDNLRIEDGVLYVHPEKDESESQAIDRIKGGLARSIEVRANPGNETQHKIDDKKLPDMNPGINNTIMDPTDSETKPMEIKNTGSDEKVILTVDLSVPEYNIPTRNKFVNYLNYAISPIERYVSFFLTCPQIGDFKDQNEFKLEKIKLVHKVLNDHSGLIVKPEKVTEPILKQKEITAYSSIGFNIDEFIDKLDTNEYTLLRKELDIPASKNLDPQHSSTASIQAVDQGILQQTLSDFEYKNLHDVKLIHDFYSRTNNCYQNLNPLPDDYDSRFDKYPLEISFKTFDFFMENNRRITELHGQFIRNILERGTVLQELQISPIFIRLLEVIRANAMQYNVFNKLPSQLLSGYAKEGYFDVMQCSLLSPYFELEWPWTTVSSEQFDLLFDALMVKLMTTSWHWSKESINMISNTIYHLLIKNLAGGGAFGPNVTTFRRNFATINYLNLAIDNKWVPNIEKLKPFLYVNDDGSSGFMNRQKLTNDIPNQYKKFYNPRPYAFEYPCSMEITDPANDFPEQLIAWYQFCNDIQDFKFRDVAKGRAITALFAYMSDEMPEFNYYYYILQENLRVMSLSSIVNTSRPTSRFRRIPKQIKQGVFPAMFFVLNFGVAKCKGIGTDFIRFGWHMHRFFNEFCSIHNVIKARTRDICFFGDKKVYELVFSLLSLSIPYLPELKEKVMKRTSTFVMPPASLYPDVYKRKYEIVEKYIDDNHLHFGYAKHFYATYKYNTAILKKFSYLSHMFIASNDKNDLFQFQYDGKTFNDLIVDNQLFQISEESRLQGKNVLIKMPVKVSHSSYEVFPSESPDAFTYSLDTGLSYGKVDVQSRWKDLRIRPGNKYAWKELPRFCIDKPIYIEMKPVDVLSLIQSRKVLREEFNIKWNFTYSDINAF